MTNTLKTRVEEILHIHEEWLKSQTEVVVDLTFKGETKTLNFLPYIVQLLMDQQERIVEQEKIIKKLEDTIILRYEKLIERRK